MHSKVVLYDYAMSMVGQPYRWGGDDTIEGFDCSGLCIEILKAAGVLPAGSDMTAEGLRLFFNETQEEVSFGTLAFFGKTSATHVGFCLNSLMMLEAGGGGSSTKTREDAAKQNAFVRIRPISGRADLLEFKQPKYKWRS
jgi:cell wall-associated NlpC family hydrolase